MSSLLFTPRLHHWHMRPTCSVLCQAREHGSLDSCLDAGCKRCGHEGHRKGKIQTHSGRNTCPICPGDEEGRCQARQFDLCGCAFHRLDKQRKVVRVSCPCCIYAGWSGTFCCIKGMHRAGSCCSS